MEIVLAEDEQLVEIGRLIKEWRPYQSGSYLGGVGKDSDYVALIDGRVVAWLNGHHEQTEIWRDLIKYQEKPEGWECSYINMMYVHPDFRSLGIGSALLAQFANDAVAAGNSLAVVVPDKSSLEAKDRLPKFYGRNGYLYLDDVSGVQHLLGREI